MTLPLLALATPLIYAPAPVDNPLKGLVPYAGEGRGRFPHSMEFDYLPLSALMKGEGSFDWTALEALLKAVASRGHQTVVRVFVEYPNRNAGLPAYLRAAGVRTTHWRDSDGLNRTPDYRAPRLRRALRAFIAAFGARYDADPRLAYVTAGLLGKWGEWHDYPREDLFTPKSVQREVMDAYAKAFRRTPVLLRYPAGSGDGTYVSNATSRFGYHDDSFAFATLATAKPNDGWFFMTVLRRAGATEAWRARPIGGEIRPEVWGRVFDRDPGKDAQDFDACVRATHATWLMDSGMFSEKPIPPYRRAGAEAAVRRMGYDLTATSVAIQGGRVRLTLANRGVAPFYRPWRAQWGLLRNGRLVATAAALGRIDRIPPGASVVWDERPRFGNASGTLALRVTNPMPGGRPLGFANRDYGRAAPGWLSLGAYPR